jgi:hypothetical protein
MRRVEAGFRGGYDLLCVLELLEPERDRVGASRCREFVDERFDREVALNLDPPCYSVALSGSGRRVIF